MARPKFIQAKKTTLYSPITSTETGEIVLKNLLDLAGNQLTMTDFGDIGYITLNPGGDKAEIISFTDFTVNDDDTVSLDTGIVRGLVGVSPYGAGGTAYDQGAGAVAIVSNNPQMYDAIIDYLDDLVIAGASDASLTAKGIVESATTSEIDADATNGSTGANLSIRPDQLAGSLYRLRLPTTDQKAALAGSQGVPNASNKYLTQDNVYDSETDQTQTTQDSTVEVGEADTTGKKNALVQSFIPAKTKIRGVKLYKTTDTGSFTGTVSIALRADTGSGTPDSSSLATVTLTNAQWLALSAGEFEAIFTTEYSDLVVGDLYWIHISTSTADNSNHPNLGTNTAGGYASGSVVYGNSTDSWVAVATIDLYFKTLQGISSQIPGINPVKVKVKEYAYATSPATWTKPSNLEFIDVELWGGGGSGGKWAGNGGGGGGGGAYNKVRIYADDLGATETITIGAGGAGTAVDGDGNAGGNTSFGTLAYAYGGGAGGGNTTGSGGGGGGSTSAGGDGTTGTAGAGGGPVGGAGGDTAPAGTSTFGGGGGGDTTAGGDSYWGGAGGGRNGSAGGASYMGGGGGGGDGSTGGASTYGGNGGGQETAGTVPSGGGGGSGSLSGAGANGQARITEYYN